MKGLDSKKMIMRFDRSGIAGILDSFPGQIEDACRIGLNFRIPDSYAARCGNIVFTGLGGSAIGADLIRSYLAGRVKLPIFVNRNYTLPGFVSSRTLVIVSSYSGNTEETLSAYREARRKKARMIVITSGGKIERLARRDKVPSIIIPGSLPPRCALGYSFFPVLILFWRLRFITDPRKAIRETVKILRGLRDKKTAIKVRRGKNIAKILALTLRGKFPVIYGGQDHTDAVATRWRGQLSENSKALSSSHVFPEMNHNEIVGWENPKRMLKDFVAVILRDKDDHPAIKRRMDITKRIIERSGTKIVELYSVGGCLLSRMFSLVYIGDYVSYYLAILYGRDPAAIERIDYLKRELAKGRSS
ncbi:bifunctional phosphoglucose/phosphomannose isomerase [Candidatus Omnitrophota bacterium]